MTKNWGKLKNYLNFFNINFPSTYFPMELPETKTKPLLQISKFVLDEKFHLNASKFAIFYIYKNPKLLFHIYEIWQILKRFTGTFRRAQTLKSLPLATQELHFLN